MSQREFLIVIAHAHQCHTCRSRLTEDPERVLTGRALTEEELVLLKKLTPDDFLTPGRLISAVGVSSGELASYQDHPIVRLRHL